MPYCPNCGFPNHGNMAFCPQCGIPLKTQFSSRNIGTQPKIDDLLTSRTILANGITIGSGLALALTGLVAAFAFNSTYLTLQNILFFNGLPETSIPNMLHNIVDIIWISLMIAALGTYLLALGLINQLSRSGRAALKKRDTQASIGNGLISGGFVFATISVASIVRQVYNPEANWFSIINFLFVLLGVAILIVGIVVVFYPRHQ